MNLNHLRFITWDTLLFSHPIDYPALQRIIANQEHSLQDCHQTGLQFHLHSLLHIIDTFFNPDRVVDVITMKYQVQRDWLFSFSDQQLMEIQKKATQLRVLIECQKVYANQYWVNNKREWVVEIRILASLLRVYRVLQNLWLFFVQGYANIKTKARSQKIILPLSRLEPFVNEVFLKLQRIEGCYYLKEFPYLPNIHVLFKAWRNLLINFPTITAKDVVTEFDLRLIILAENEKYKKVYKERMLLVPESPRKVKREKEEEKEREKEREREKEKRRWDSKLKRAKSLDENIFWHKKIEVNLKLKLRRSKTLEIQMLNQKTLKRPTVRFPFQPIQLARRSKNNSHFLMERTNSSCTTIRRPSDSKSILPSKLSTTDQFMNEPSSRLNHSPRETVTRETMSPTRIAKARVRRTQLTYKVLRVIEQINPVLKEGDFERHIKQKQPLQYPFSKHYELQIKVQQQTKKSYGLKLLEDSIEIISKKPLKQYDELEYEISRVLSSKQVPITLKSRRHLKGFPSSEQLEMNVYI